MTGLWSVIIPESTEVTNLITNPSFETNTDGWTAYSAPISRYTFASRRGYCSLYVECSTALYDGVISHEIALTSGTTYTFAVDINTYIGNQMVLVVCDSAYASAANTLFVGTSDWTREVLTYSATATANFRFTVQKNNFGTATTLLLDGAGVYALDHDPGHIDGDQKDCWWNGTPNASTSTRKAGSAAGGEVTNFDDLSYYIKEFPGAGMAEVTPLLQEIGNLPGAMDAGEKIAERVFSLVGHVSGSSQAGLHSKRKGLINAVKSDRTTNKQQVKLVYSGANSERPVRIGAKFIGGLSMGAQDGFSEPMALKFLATNPFWYEDGEEGLSVTWADTVADCDFAVRRVDGSWYNVNTAFNSWVTNIVKSNGIVYLGGHFYDVGSAGGDYVVSWNGSALVAMGSGVNDAVRAMTVSPDGNVYIGGYFTSASAVANTQLLAYWDTTTSGWKEVGGGITTVASTAQRIHALAFDNSGSLYVGGTYTGNTSTALSNISVYSATGWGALSTGLDGVVYALAKGPDGYMYIGGDFDSAGGDTDCVSIGYWTGSAWGHMGTGTLGGAGNYIRAMCFDDAGNLYVGGDFTSVDGVDANYVAMWNGNQWLPLGTGLNGLVLTMSWANGLLYVGGQFTSAGGMALAEGTAIWNGTTWAPLPIDFPGTSNIHAILADGDDLYIGGEFTGTGNTSYKNTLTNSGTAIAYPKFVFWQTGPGTLTPVYIRNETTGATLWLNHAMQAGEKLTIDTGLDNRSVVSSYWGNIIGKAMLRNSDFSDFYLLPGTNYVSVFCQVTLGTEAAVVYAMWPIAHWSLDGSAT